MAHSGLEIHARSGARCVLGRWRQFAGRPACMRRRGGSPTDRVRGYSTNKLPHPQVSKEFPGKVETSTRYIVGKVISRLEMDSRWALARSVRALVTERDALKEKLEGNSSRQPKPAQVEAGTF
jgi:hypothetical protein